MTRIKHSDLNAQSKSLQQYFEQWAAKQATKHPDLNPAGFAHDAGGMMARAMHALARRMKRHYGNVSRHKPHQGAQECARRVRQMANGTHGL